MNSYINLKKARKHDFRPVLGCTGSIKMKNWSNLSEKARKFGRNNHNPTLGNWNYPYPSPMAMNGYTYMKQAWDHDFRPVLGYSGSIKVRNWPNLGEKARKFGRNHHNPTLGNWNYPYPSPIAMNSYIYLKQAWKHDFRPVLGCTGSIKVRNWPNLS